MSRQSDESFMQRALTIAKKGIGWTYPNPMVGAVIVINGKIIEEGYHKRVGFPHAEIETMHTLKGSSLKDAILYVNLEPCCHSGRTPPCTDTIIKQGIKRVVCATLDPNPKVSGRGVTLLKKAGIEVTVGIMKEEARRLNEAYFTYHEKKRPFIAVKFAASLDGKIATKTGDSKWITREKARIYARKLRGQFQGICVGATTVIRDNPHLGTRVKGQKDPLRIIFDPHLRTPPVSLVYRDSNVLLFCANITNPSKKRLFEKKGVNVVSISSNPFNLNEVLRYLNKREIISVLVEGGAATLGCFFDSKLVDKVYAFHAPLILGGAKALNAVGGLGVTLLTYGFRLHNITRKRLGDDLLTIGYL